ncbi:MAG: PilZ domain-containing protein [Thermoanaerobaculia bacterium]
MTAIAELPFTTVAAPERRRTARFRLSEPVEATVGRDAGPIIDISSGGARIRHTRALGRGVRVRVVFAWRGRRFEGTGEVVRSRVVGIERNETVFESRIRFLSFSDASLDLLETMLQEIADADLQKWVANLRGWEARHPTPAEQATRTTRFLRCRLINGKWQQRLTGDPAPPADGFTVAAGTEPSEIRALCRTFETADAEARRLLRQLASAVLEQQIA